MWPGLAHSIGIQGSKYEGSIVQERCSITFYDILSETTHHHFWLFLLVSTVYTYIHIYYTYIYTYAIYIVYTYIFINKWEEKNTDNYKYSHSFKKSQDLVGIHNIHFPLPIPCPFYPVWAPHLVNVLYLKVEGQLLKCLFLIVQVSCLSSSLDISNLPNGRPKMCLGWVTEFEKYYDLSRFCCRYV